MVARIGLQLPRWFRVKRKNSVVLDGVAWGVVPNKSEAAVELAFPLGADGAESLEGCGEMLSIRVTDVFDANVMNHIVGVKGFDWWGISVVDEMVA
jgi:hypothetical protein